MVICDQMCQILSNVRLTGHPNLSTQKNHEKESTGRIPDDGEPDTRLQAALHHGCQNWSEVAFFHLQLNMKIEGRGAPTRAGRSRLPRMQVTLGQRNPLAFPCQDLPSIEDQK